MELFQNLAWWHWTVLGVGLMIAELLMPAFILIWFGAGALLAALLLAMVPELSLTAQILTWTISSIIMAVLWFKVFEPARHKIRAGQSAEIVGHVGMLASDVAPYQKGRVRFQKPLIGSDNWECIADESIANGERVRVVAIEGSLLKVTKA